MIKQETIQAWDSTAWYFTWTAETFSPTTPIRNIIFKMVNWGNISDLTWQCIPCYSFIDGGNWSIRRKPPTYRKSLTSFITQLCIKYTLPWTGFKLTTLVMIGTNDTGNCKSNYHTVTTTTVPSFPFGNLFIIMLLFL